MGQRFAGLGLMDRGSGTITERTRLTRIKAATGAAPTGSFRLVGAGPRAWPEICWRQGAVHTGVSVHRAPVDTGGGTAL